MKRYYPENRSYFTREEDAALFEYDEMGLTIAEQAERLERPFGSVATRRRALGLSKVRGKRETVPVNPEVDSLLGRIAFWSFAAALGLAGVFALMGGNGWLQ